MKKFSIFLTVLLLCVAPATLQAQRVVDDAIPDPMPPLDVPEEVTIFLLFGTATDNPTNPGLADMLMLAAVNRTVGSVALLAIPRDLFVHVPGFDMRKINTAYYLGETHQQEGGGVQLLIDTVRYNLGVEVDYYANVNFDGFMDIIDAVGGIEVAVDCTIRDWKLKERGLNKLVEENYEMFAMPVGMHHMDALTALWYVRSRKTSSDIDRGRRQQDVLRAIWRKIRERGILTDLPMLWDQVTQSVRTDLTLADVLGFVPMATEFEPERITSYRLKMGTHIRNALSPAPEYAAILAFDREAVQALLKEFVSPPTPNQIARARLTVELVNTSGVKRLAWVAADRLAQEGFMPVVIDETSHFRQNTAIYDYTGATKANPLPDLQRVLRVSDEGVVISPDPQRTSDYKIYIGHQYLYWACTRDVIQPRLTIDSRGNVIVDEATPTPQDEESP